MNGLIIGDNFHARPRISIGRANGAHRIATVFRNKGVDVDVIDFFNSWTNEELEKFVERYSELSFLGISVGLGRVGGKPANFLISLLRKKFPKLLVIVGGSDVLRNDFKGVDLYFKGFAEGAIDNIIEFIKTGTFDPQYVNKMTTHGERDIVNCDTYFKSYDLTNLKTGYTPNDFIQKNEMLTLETSRGCIFKCSFCNFPFTGKKKNEYIREKEDVKAEIIENYEKYGTTRYLITDDTFNDNEYKVDMMYEISQEIDFKLNFMCYARIDLLHAKQDQLKKVVAFGMKGMNFGLETLKESTSKLVGKGFGGQRLKNYLMEIREQYPELHITASFICGLPDETLAEFRENFQWMIDNKAADALALFNLAIHKDNSVNNISIFSKNWKSYGYEEMTEEDKAKYPDFRFADFGGLTFDQHAQHYINWKNDNTNIVEALKLKEEILKETENFSTYTGWKGFSHAFASDDLQKYLFAKKSDIGQEQVNAVADYLAHYKFKKIRGI
jgi:radical SAM superfamily enzyme YgiQ (UPF0313 family)